MSSEDIEDSILLEDITVTLKDYDHPLKTTVSPRLFRNSTSSPNSTTAKSKQTRGLVTTSLGTNLQLASKTSTLSSSKSQSGIEMRKLEQ